MKNNRIVKSTLFAFILITYSYVLLLSKERITEAYSSLQQSLQSFFAPEQPSNDLPILKITLDENDVLKLNKYAKQAIANKRISKKEKKQVKCSLLIENERIHGDLRLKGDDIDHVLSTKKSFRINLQDKKEMFGNSSFSISHPKTRGYLYEYFTHQVFKKNTILTTEYNFINVEVNKGLHSIEEHFSSFKF
jgi:hypothetical protein